MGQEAGGAMTSSGGRMEPDELAVVARGRKCRKILSALRGFFGRPSHFPLAASASPSPSSLLHLVVCKLQPADQPSSATSTRSTPSAVAGAATAAFSRRRRPRIAASVGRGRSGRSVVQLRSWLSTAVGWLLCPSTCQRCLVKNGQIK
ncbi:uncharacterized protein [Lolium perenne]|uniref:uncharacterized protein isoform X2 n=1 Tax=Lolium perenne TaxID=4522 RepID=UPI003A996CD2